MIIITAFLLFLSVSAMKIVIDTPVNLVRRNPSSPDGHPSWSLEYLGGAFWFPGDAVPLSIQPGYYMGATCEARAYNARTDNGVRSSVLPTRLLEVVPQTKR